MLVPQALQSSANAIPIMQAASYLLPKDKILPYRNLFSRIGRFKDGRIYALHIQFQFNFQVLPTISKRNFEPAKLCPLKCHLSANDMMSGAGGNKVCEHC